jgi:biotin operon repressor
VYYGGKITRKEAAMPDTMPIKPSTREVLTYLDRCWPNFVSVPRLIEECRQTDVRKRVSEARAAGYPIEVERNGRFVSYRWTA